MMGRRTFCGAGLVLLFAVLALYQVGSAEERYLVKPGDTLSGISKAFGVRIERLREANHLKGDAIKPQQVLVIPTPNEKQSAEPATSSPRSIKKDAEQTLRKPSAGTDSYIVRKGDSLYLVAKKTGLSIEEIKGLNQLQSTSLKVGQTLTLSRQKPLPEDPEEEAGDAAGEGITEQVAEKGAENEDAPEVLGKWTNPEERSLLVRLVKTFLGAPYRLGGSTLKGIDCSAFVKKIYEVFNVHLPRTTREQLGIGMKVKKEELREGDLVFFRTRTARVSNAHVGIYIGNDEFVHASSRNKEVKIDSLNAPYFSSRFMKGVRVKELETEL